LDYQTENRETEREIGFIAQEVQHVVPELVFKSDKENSYYQEVKNAIYSENAVI
jgi:hypothetical protein